jgi:hypothetical protein
MSKQNPDPFYEWLDHEGIRDLVKRAGELETGERMVLVKGLVPGLVTESGLAEFESFVDELRREARRFEEARTHPGEGNDSRRVPGEALGGPTPTGHLHLPEHRDTQRPGGRDAERERESQLWASREEGRGGRA